MSYSSVLPWHFEHKCVEIQFELLKESLLAFEDILSPNILRNALVFLLISVVASEIVKLFLSHKLLAIFNSLIIEQTFISLHSFHSSYLE